MDRSDNSLTLNAGTLERSWIGVLCIRRMQFYASSGLISSLVDRTRDIKHSIYVRMKIGPVYRFSVRLDPLLLIPNKSKLSSGGITGGSLKSRALCL